MRLLLLMLLAASFALPAVAEPLALGTVATPDAPPVETPIPALAPLQFLVGHWQALPDATGATGLFSFDPEVQGQVIVRTSYAEYPAIADKPAARHDDLMTIYVEGDTLKADYFDSEGHVIRYTITTPADNQAIFQSDASAPGPIFKLAYTLQVDGTLAGAFDIAPPGKPEAFQTYLQWSAKKTN